MVTRVSSFRQDGFGRVRFFAARTVTRVLPFRQGGSVVVYVSVFLSDAKTAQVRNRNEKSENIAPRVKNMVLHVKKVRFVVGNYGDFFVCCVGEGQYAYGTPAVRKI